MAKHHFELSNAAFMKEGDTVMSPLSEVSMWSNSQRIQISLANSSKPCSPSPTEKRASSHSSARIKNQEKVRSEAIEVEKVNLAKEAHQDVLSVLRNWNTFHMVGIFALMAGKTKELTSQPCTEELVAYVLLVLTGVCHFITTIASYKRSLSFALPGPFALQCFLIAGEFSILGESQDHSGLDVKAQTVSVAANIVRAYFVLFMQLINSVVIWQVVELRWFKSSFCVLTLLASFVLVQLTLNNLGLYQDFQVAMQTSMLYVMACLTLVIAVRATSKLAELPIQTLLKQKAESNQFKRIVDSSQEAILVVKEKEVTFQNQMAHSLHQLKNISITSKIFYLYSDASDSRQLSTGKESISSDQFEKGRGYSIADLMKPKRSVLRKQFVFTFSPAIAACDNINQIKEVVNQEKTGSEPGEYSPEFQFFLVNSFKIEQSFGQTSSDYVFQLTDFSQKIMYDHLSVERKYMSYLNSTISHEMRNPLNSITAQTHVMKSLLTKFQSLLGKGEEPTQLSSEFVESLEICEASCKMLAFNVEDILALPQLKEGKFTKNIQAVNAERATEEVMRIQKYQANTKGIRLHMKTHGFDAGGTRVQLDEKRYQQVVLNYQSNALKFINRKDGEVLLHLSLVPPEQESADTEGLLREMKDLSMQFYGFNMFEESRSRGESNLEGESILERPCSDLGEESLRPLPKVLDPFKLFRPQEFAKLVLTVFDNGVGIKEGDSSKLFKLFGCLKATQQMNTQGIGLGLVITKMITEEFEGQTQLFSKSKFGSIFQSSFLLKPKRRNSHAQVQIKALPEFLKRKEEVKEGEVSIDYQQRILAAKAFSLKKCQENLPALTGASPVAGGFNENRILIVDDEAFNVQALRAMIKALEFKHSESRVDVAYSGEEALDLVQRSIRPTISGIKKSLGSEPKLREVQRMSALNSEKQISCQDDSTVVSSKYNRRVRAEQNLESAYGLILTDCSMPFMDGYQCALHIHNILESNGISEDKPSIVAVTGHVESEYQRKAVLSGIDMVYSKPMKSETLWMILASHNFEVGVKPQHEKLLRELS